MKLRSVVITCVLPLLAVQIALAADQRVLPERALQWQPKEYPEATLHAGVAYLEPEREWERMDVWVPKTPSEGKLPCVVAIFGGGYGDKMGESLRVAFEADHAERASWFAGGKIGEQYREFNTSCNPSETTRTIPRERATIGG